MLDELPTKHCGKCKVIKPLSEFRRNRARKDGLQNYCIPCGAARCAQWWCRNSDRLKVAKSERLKVKRAKNRRFIYEYLLTHPCVDCGEPDPVVLDFDHVRGEKMFHVACLISHSLARIETEIAKCDIRCANCHRRKTARIGKWKSRLPS